MTLRLIFCSLFMLVSLHLYGDQQHPSLHQVLIESLEKQKSDILSAKEEWISKFQKRASFHAEETRKLAEIEHRLRNNRDYADLLQDYNFVVSIWRKFADHSFENISGSNIERSFPSLPPLEDLHEGELASEDLLTTQQLYDEVKQLLAEAIQAFDQRRDKDALAYNRILLAAGKLRSQQYQRLEQLGYLIKSPLVKSNREDFLRELKIIPVRWTATFYSKMLEFKDYSSEGLEGYFYIAKEISIFFLLIGFAFFFIWAFRKIVTLFENFADNLSKKLDVSASSGIWSYTLSVVNKSIPWVVLLMGVSFANGLVRTSSFHELSYLFPYVDFYVYYRIYLILTNDLFMKLKTSGFLNLNLGQRGKFLNINRSLGWLAFLSVALLHTIDTVVGQAMVHSIVLNILYFVYGFYIFYITYLWREEIFTAHEWEYFTRKLSNRHHKSIKKFSYFSSFLAAMIILVFKGFNLFVSYLSHFDFFKKLSALLLKVHLNKTHEEEKRVEHDLPDEYMSQFQPQELSNLFVGSREEFHESKETIEKWIKGASDTHSLLIYGAKGSGKSALLSKLCDSIKGAESHLLHLDKKNISAEGIVSKIGKIVGCDTVDVDILIKHLEEKLTKKTVIYVDNVHNLFLSQVNGFGALKALMTLINADVDNVFWCVSLHRESWHYIRRALEEYLCFEKIIEIEPCSAEELQQFIIAAHHKSGFKISFDNLLVMLGKKKRSDARVSIESRFFKLLWEQTDGNPALAVQLWLRSLKFDGRNTIKVIKPPMENIQGFLDLSDDFHFMCAALVRHESLKREHLSDMLQESSRVIARLIKIAVEKKYVTEDEHGCLQINLNVSNQIIRALRRKNYVYG